LQRREVELRHVVNAYDEEVIVRQAHQETEITLNKVTLGLKGVAARGLSDIETCLRNWVHAFLRSTELYLLT
jgi:kinesin family protein 11